jgi:hypothetical protein
MVVAKSYSGGQWGAQAIITRIQSYDSDYDNDGWIKVDIIPIGNPDQAHFSFVQEGHTVRILLHNENPVFYANYFWVATRLR